MSRKLDQRGASRSTMRPPRDRSGTGAQGVAPRAVRLWVGACGSSMPLSAPLRFSCFGSRGGRAGSSGSRKLTRQGAAVQALSFPRAHPGRFFRFPFFGPAKKGNSLAGRPAKPAVGVPLAEASVQRQLPTQKRRHPTGQQPMCKRASAPANPPPPLPRSRPRPSAPRPAAAIGGHALAATYGRNRGTPCSSRSSMAIGRVSISTAAEPVGSGWAASPRVSASALR